MSDGSIDGGSASSSRRHEAFTALLERGGARALRAALGEIHPAEVTDWFESLPARHRDAAWSCIDPARRHDVLAEIEYVPRRGAGSLLAPAPEAGRSGSAPSVPCRRPRGTPMTLRRMQALLRGAGSIMDLYPDPDRYARFVPAGTAEERLGEIWGRAGRYIHDAAGRVHRESGSCARPEEEEGAPTRERGRRSSC